MPSDSEVGLARQLEWLSSAPNLVVPPDLALPEGLLGLSVKPQGDYHVSARRLGLQFEQLLQIYLQNHSQVSDIESNISVREDKITIGEADLLFRFRETWWHLEVALKFYLRQPGIDGLGGYYGPNRRDRFDLKWQHMLNHQTQILEHPSATPLLRERGIEQLRRSVLIKGWLFQHPLDRREDRPDPINPIHQRGWWVHKSELQGWLSKQPSSASYLVVPKPFWLRPLRVLGQVSFSAAQLLAYLENREFPTQIWILLGVGRSRQLLSRGYVVSDDWEQSDD